MAQVLKGWTVRQASCILVSAISGTRSILNACGLEVKPVPINPCW